MAWVFYVFFWVFEPGSNIDNFHFLWKVPSNADITECFEQSQPAVKQVKQQLPIHHSWAMRPTMFKMFGCITLGVKPAVLHYFYEDFTDKYKFNNHCELSSFWILFSSSIFLKSLFLLHVLHTGDQLASSNLDQLGIDKRVE